MRRTFTLDQPPLEARFVQLSEKLFVEIIGITGDDASLLTPQDERRASPRANLGCRARIFPLLEASANIGQPVLVRDISVHGVGMLAGEPMTSGDEFVIHLPTSNSPFGSEPVQIQCCVRRCQSGGTGNTQFFIGSTFELVLNRPLTYAIANFPETSEDAAPSVATTVEWDPFAPSEVEKRFDVQTRESMLHRPQREPIVDQLSHYLLARLIGRLLLLTCRPILKIARALGILRSVDLTSFKIRNRLATNRSRKVRTLKELAYLDTTDSPDGDVVADSSKRPQTYAERSVITALDSASQYVAGMEDTLPPASTAAPLTGLEKRVSLFAIAQSIGEAPAESTAESIAVSAPIAAPQSHAPESSQQVSVMEHAPLPSSEPPVQPIALPLVVPTFELPAIGPIPAPATPEPLSEAVSVQATDHLVHQLLSTSPTSPAEAKPKKSTAAAWRSRHRPVLNQSPRDRPKLGR